MVRDGHPYMAEGGVTWELIPGTALMKQRGQIEMDWVFSLPKPSPGAYFPQIGHSSSAFQDCTTTGHHVFKYLSHWGTLLFK